MRHMKKQSMVHLHLVSLALYTQQEKKDQKFYCRPYFQNGLHKENYLILNRVPCWFTHDPLPVKPEQSSNKQHPTDPPKHRSTKEQ